MTTIREVAAADISSTMPQLFADVAHDAADLDWRCVAPWLLPPVAELQAVADAGTERVVVLEQTGVGVGFVLIGMTGQFRWLILDSSQFTTLFDELCTWVLGTFGLAPWGIVGGDNAMLAAILDHPRMTLEEQSVNDGVTSSLVRWV